MNTKLINYWKEDYPEIKKELLRISKMAFQMGGNTANWVLPSYLDRTAIAKTEETFRESLEGHLKTQTDLRLSLNNPFSLLNEDLSYSLLAEKFAIAYLSTSSPEEVLQWLEKVDKYELRVIDLAVGVSHFLVTNELVRILNLGFHGWLIEQGKIEPDSEPIDLPNDDIHDLDSANSDDSTSVAIFEPAGKSKTFKPKVKSARVAAMEKLHGFPWMNEPSERTKRSIHNYLLENKMIEPSIPVSEIGALFTEEGPSAPIRFLKCPGKLVMFFRLLTRDVLKSATEIPNLEDFSTKAIRSSSYWLYPRLIGTFRDKNGERFTTIQLSKSAGQYKVDELDTLDWFIKMEESLQAAS
ncbi:hypothetical protein [Adhaeribacter soli]|uniref:Uncharacterized protein n=1 Tax=Adhaeribacter soli TaxID=2607655 RepID=A0A5N1J0B6_9BACT|nr:hypothetical protein [Adhaeribacter soli]KAA9340145.1 hypothetical protein F0P94_07290 [Adhaeribacter soli]